MNSRVIIHKNQTYLYQLSSFRNDEKDIKNEQPSFKQRGISKNKQPSLKLEEIFLRMKTYRRKFFDVVVAGTERRESDLLRELGEGRIGKEGNVTDQLVADVRLRRVKRLRRVADVLKIILFGFHVNLIVKQIFQAA